MVRQHVPDRGDVVWIHFTPQAGHEQAGHRRAQVLFPTTYNGKTGLMLCCPVTSQVKGYPFEVPLDARAGVRGVVLSDQVKSLDWRARRAKRKGEVARVVIDQTLARVRVLLA